MQFKTLSAIAVMGSFVFAGASHAELRINPFPLSDDQNAPKADAAPIALEKRDAVTVIKTETHSGEPVEMVLPLPEPEALDVPPAQKTFSKADRERALYDSLNVPTPGSSYFDENGSLPPPEDMMAVAVEPVADPVVKPMDELEPIDLQRMPEPIMVESAPKPAEPLSARMSDRLSDQLAEQGLAALDSEYAPPILPPLEEEEMSPRGEEVVVAVEPAMMPIEAPSQPEYVQRHDPSKLVRLDLENKKIERLDGEMLGRVSGNAPVATQMVASIEPLQAKAIDGDAYAPMQQWVAEEGESIRVLLQDWSVQAGVKLVWDSRNEFAVLDGFSAESAYEHAVKALLDQYEDDQVRPVAKLHLDPETQERVLVVQLEGL